jgi:hypothetical protein
MTAKRAMGISVHTGWGACVVVGGSQRKPEIFANQVIEVLGQAERFCFHRAAEMERGAAGAWLADLRRKAITNARKSLAPLLEKTVEICALVAKEGAPGDLDAVLNSHPRIHTAEGCFYRDVLCEACSLPIRIVSPASLDPAKLGKLPTSPWGRDQKLAALAAWAAISAHTGRPT